MLLSWLLLLMRTTSLHANTDEEDYVIFEGDIYVEQWGGGASLGGTPALRDVSGLADEAADLPDEESGSRMVEDDFLPVFAASSISPLYETHERRKRAVTAIPDRLWPNATIPFVFGSNITDDMASTIMQAMGHWERHTCIRFLNRTTEIDYIEFEPGRCGCCSYVGRKGERQLVTISSHCAVYGVVVHELGHVIGFWHEHSRPDRDRHIKIIKENIIPEKLDNFDKKAHFEIDSLGQPYDYYSIMHYRKRTFSRNNRNSIEPKQKGARIGQRDGLSPGDVIQANLLYKCPKPQCYEEFTRMEGNFSTPNYPVKYYKEHKCTWIIHVLPGENVVLEFLDFAIEKSVNCSFDYVELREGIDETGELIGRLCGEGLPGYIEASSSLWVRFISDSSITMRGFFASYKKKKDPDDFIGSGSGMIDDYFGSGGSGYGLGRPISTAKYKALCNSYLVSPRGEILSPLVPALFRQNSIDCSWTIDGGLNSSGIQLTLDLLHMTVDSDACMGDIYQKLPAEGRFHKHRKRIKNLTTKDRSVNYSIDRYAPVEYSCRKSDVLMLDSMTVMLQWSADVHQGFRLSYIIDYDECALRTSGCDHFCHNTLEGYTCTCRPGFMLHADGEQCVHKFIQLADHCDTNLTMERGKIRAGTEPMAECYYYILLPDSYKIYLAFNRFRIPQNKTMNATTCDQNYLEVMVGRGKHVKSRHCGNQRPEPVALATNILTLRIHTDLSSGMGLPYFTAKYMAYKEEGMEKCFRRLKAQGNVTSPGHPGDYPANSFCIWRISARRGQHVHMTFQLLDMEPTRQCNFDYLEVRDGKHRTSELLGRFCGDILPTDIISTGRHLWLMFVSDSSGTGRGFSAALESQPDRDLNLTDTSHRRSAGRTDGPRRHHHGETDGRDGSSSEDADTSAESDEEEEEAADIL